MGWVYWAILGAALLHIGEECATGFLAWFRRALPSLAAGMTVRWAVAINALFLLVCLGAAALPAAPAIARLVAPGIVLVNAVLHVGMTLARREYSPGLVTACVLYVPLGWIAFDQTARVRGLGASEVLMAGLLSVAVHAIAPISLRVLANRAGRVDRAGPPTPPVS